LGILVAAIIAWKFVDAYSQSIQPSSFRSFSVSGDGKITAVPDVAQFTFEVITEGGTNIAGLQTQNTEKMNAAIAFVKSKGVDAKDIKTQNYNLTPRYQYSNCGYTPQASKPCPPPEIVGYTVTQTVSVKIRDFSKISDILGGVVSKGANSVSNLNFVIDDPTAAESDARTEAIGKAKTKAQAVAKAGGFSLGRILSITEGGNYPVYYDKYSTAAVSGMGGGVAAPAPTIEPGSQDVTITVSIQYEIR